MSQPANPQPNTGRTHLSRRNFLRGVGVCVALPAFESLLPRAVRAAVSDAVAPMATTATGAPVRMAFVYFPNGSNQHKWWPTGEGSDWQLGPTMAPLASLKQKLQVLSGMDDVSANPEADGAGDHARANGTFLTAVRLRKTAGADIQAGISIDQVAAERIGHLTRFPSLELSCEPVRKSGLCDSGYSCAYQYNVSWKSATTPMAPEANPRLVFERLFGAGARGERVANYKLRQQQQRSVLDFVLEDTRTLRKELANRDGKKLDEYLSGVRDIEQRIERAERSADPPDPNIETPVGIPVSYQEHMQIMYSMLALAFQTDSTRVATLMLSHDGSNRSFPDIGVNEGHHDISHHRDQDDLLTKIAAIDLWYVQQFAGFLQKLEEIKDVDGRTLLDNSMIVYGCGNADGNRHTHENLPIILAGGGGGSLQTGRYAKFQPTPISNLFLSMIDRLGVTDVDRFGDSTGRLQGI